jgi:hypothetical protein
VDQALADANKGDPQRDEPSRAHGPQSVVPKAIIVPHAGYVYSGKVAAKGYALLQAHPPKQITLVGPSHSYPFDGSVTSAQIWETPLGTVKMHPCQGLDIRERAFEEEHSLEVQLPFLLTVAPKARITPILYCNETPEHLASHLDNDSFIIVSSDLSHFHSYDAAKKRDKASIDSMLSLDVKGAIDACGDTGIKALLLLAKKNGWKPKFIEYKNSGDTSGDKSRVVGYATIAFY